VEAPCAAIDSDFAGVWLVEASQDFHERTFAGAVFADKRVHLAARDR
jgi:hypothetical protein